MKTVLLFLTLLCLNLNAAVSIDSVTYTEGDIPPDARVVLFEFEVTSDTTEAPDILELMPTGTANPQNIIRQVLILDQQSNVVGKTAEVSDRFRLLFKDAVLKPGEGWYSKFRVAVDTRQNLDTEAGKMFGLQVVGLSTVSGSEISGNFPFGGSVHLVRNNVEVGKLIAVRRGSPHQKVNAAIIAKDEMPLGDLEIEISHVERLAANGIPFRIYATGGLAWDMKNMRAVDANNKQIGIAGLQYATPSYAVYILSPDDASSLPTGISKLVFKGKPGSTFSNGGTIAIATNPAEWTGVRGVEYKNLCALPDSGLVLSSTLTLIGPRLDVTIIPTTEHLVSSGRISTVMTYVYDAAQSGEDLRVDAVSYEFMTLKLQWKSHIKRMWLEDATDGNKVITGSHSPASYEDRNALYIQDGFAVQHPTGIIVSAGSKKIFKLQVEFSEDAEGVYAWALLRTAPTAVGVSSGRTVIGNIVTGYSIVTTTRKD